MTANAIIERTKGRRVRVQIGGARPMLTREEQLAAIYRPGPTAQRWLRSRIWSAWETSFLRSMADRSALSGPLSERQAAVMRGLATKYLEARS